MKVFYYFGILDSLCNSKFNEICAIWELSSAEGEQVSSFDGLADLGVRHFGDLYTAQPGASIAEVLRVAQLFPRFVGEEDNRLLMEEVS